MAKQVFSTLTESIQGPCQGNQQTLAHSRLWDAVGGFLFLFAHMQNKLSKNSSQLNLLIELLDLQKEMVVMMLSMLEGNVVNGAIGKQMVDTFVESSANLELILKFFDIFLKLKPLTSSSQFQEIDKRGIGWVTATDFRKAMDQQKVYTKEEIEFLMECCEPNHDGLIDYLEFTERFHNPAKEIGFNLAVLLTNLNEHMPGDVRLSRFLEIAASVLNYFEPYLGRIEILGSSSRVERVYFEIQETTLNQWGKPQIRESKQAFLYNVVNEGGDKEKLEMFVDFCEDAIFEMKHAASISKEDDEEGERRAAKYPFINEDEGKFSLMEPFKQLTVYLFMQVLRFFSYLTPANIKKQINNMKEKTAVELVIGFFKLIMNMFLFSGSFVYSIVRYCLRILLRLMKGEGLAGSQIREEEVETAEIKDRLALPSSYVPPASGTTATPMPSINKSQPEQTAPTVKVTPAGTVDPTNKTAETDLKEENKEAVSNEARASISGNKLLPENKNDAKSSSKTNLTKEVKKEDVKQVGGAGLSVQPVSVYEEPATEVNKEEHATPVLKSFSFNIGKYINRFICFLARNYYMIKNIALVIAFIINFGLLFYKIASKIDQENGDLVNGLIQNLTESSEQMGVGNLIAESSGEDLGSDESGSDEDVGPEEFVSTSYEYLPLFLRILAVSHSILSLCMLIGYYQLKLPLVIFKREKEISRAMEFDGLYIIEQNVDENKSKWDKIVISTPSFPGLYWDKFVKKRVRDAYSEQYDYDSITKMLGMTNDTFASSKDSPENLPFWRRIIKINGIDFKYQIWKAGVTVTDQLFLYNLGYFVFSVLGNVNYFFFAPHLLDLAQSNKSLKTILQSVTHNGRQFMLTVALLTIVVYIYTVCFKGFFFSNRLN